MKLLSKKYFEDYEIQEKPDETGKMSRQLVYVGDTYSVCLPEEKYRKRKKIFAILSALCAALFPVVNLQNTESNIVGILPAFGVIVVIPLFVLCYGCICGLWKKPVMTRGDYVEHSMMVKFGGFLTAALGLLNTVWHGSFLIGSALPESRGKELFVTVLWFILTVISALLWVTEFRTEYIIRNKYGAVVHQEHFKRR